MAHNPQHESQQQDVHKRDKRKRPARIHSATHGQNSRRATRTHQTPREIHSRRRSSRLVAVQLYKQPVGNVERARNAKAHDEQSDFRAGDMRSEIQGPAEDNQADDAYNMRRDEDFQANTLNWKVAEILLLAADNGDAELVGVASEIPVCEAAHGHGGKEGGDAVGNVAQADVEGIEAVDVVEEIWDRGNRHHHAGEEEAVVEQQESGFFFGEDAQCSEGIGPGDSLAGRSRNVFSRVGFALLAVLDAADYGAVYASGGDGAVAHDFAARFREEEDEDYEEHAGEDALEPEDGAPAEVAVEEAADGRAKGGAYEDACLSISHVGTAIGGCGNVGDDGHAEGDGGRAADGLEHP